MNKITFDHYKEMPVCDICESVCVSLETERHVCNTLRAEITFACGAAFQAECRARFSSDSVNGQFECYSPWGRWSSIRECKNAAMIVRQQRKKMQEESST